MTKLSSITVILFSIALLGVGCARPGDIATQSDPAEVVQEDASGLIQVGEEGAVTLYEGEVVISGIAFVDGVTADICIMIDEASQAVLPESEVWTPRVCFVPRANTETALNEITQSLFGLDFKDVHADEMYVNINPDNYRTVRIRNYKRSQTEIAQDAYTTLIEVLSK